METFERLKFLIFNLTEEERNKFAKEIKMETNYAKLFDLIQHKPYEALIDAKKKKESVKKLNDEADYLTDKLIRYFAGNPTNQMAKHCLQLNEILFLLDKEVPDLAAQKAKALIQQVSGNHREAWLLVCLLEQFYAHPQLKKRLESVKVLYSFCSGMKGFYNLDLLQTESPVEFIRFIETFKKEVTEKRNELAEIDRELYHSYSLAKTPGFARRMELILKKAYMLAKHPEFAISHGNQKDLMFDCERELSQNALTHGWSVGAHYTMVAFYTDMLLTQEQLLYAIHQQPASIPEQSMHLLNANLMEDILLRIEVNRILIRLFTFNPWADKATSISKSLLKDFAQLLKQMDAVNELSICLKTLYVMFVKSTNKAEANSTLYKYQNQIKEFENPFYYSAIQKNSALIESDDKTNFLMNLVYQYKLQNKNPDNY